MVAACEERKVLGECKKHSLQVLVCLRRCAQFGESRELRDRAFTAYAAAAEQHEPVAEARGIADLVNGEEERPAARHVYAQRRRDVTRLPQIEPVERLVDEQCRLRRE